MEVSIGRGVHDKRDPTEEGYKRKGSKRCSVQKKRDPKEEEGPKEKESAKKRSPKQEGS